MNAINFELFNHYSVPDKWQRMKISTRIGLYTVITFVPLLFFALSDAQTQGLFKDISVFVRFLVSMPLFLSIPELTGNILRPIVQHFMNAQIVEGDQIGPYQEIVASTLQLKDSSTAKIVLLLLVGTILLLNMYMMPTYFAHTWKSAGGHLTLPGKWYFFISLPVFNFLVLHFLYLGLLWWRFLYRVSRLKLSIMPSHGDSSGGLGFLSLSISAFYAPLFAFSATIAAEAANLIVHEKINFPDLKLILLIFAIFCYLFFVGPLCFFYPILVKFKARGIYNYGKLSGLQIEAFEKKWIHRRNIQEDEVLASNNFSNVIDALSIVEKARSMRLLPFGMKNLIVFTMAIVLPFLPVAALELNWKVILTQLVQFVI